MKKIFAIIVIGILCISMFSVLTPKVMGWASSIPTKLHGDMAVDSLAETGWSDSEIAKIKDYACEEHYTDYHHRVDTYQDKLHSYHSGMDELLGICKCKKEGLHGGAEDGSYQYIEWARSNYTTNNIDEALKCLGYAIHFIQDSVCPPHVFPFQDLGFAIGAAPQFEEYTALPGQYVHKWQSHVSGASKESIGSALDLRQRVEAAADEVWNRFSSYSSGFGYKRQDGEYIGDHSGVWADWKMSDDDIGWCMEKAASLVKGAASWVIGGSIATISKGLDWLRKHQNSDGSWLFSESSVGPTSMAMMSSVNFGTSLDDEMVQHGLNFIVSHRNSDGSFGSLKTYETSLALLALCTARAAGYNPSVPDVDQYIKDALSWLLSNQNIESNVAIDRSNKYYGGWGYNGADSSWADLSNTQFALIALSMAESWLKESPHIGNWQAASTFVTRCNNNATNNPQYYLKDDGGFIYQPQSTTRTSTGDSYGSMTAAGVWVLGLARMAGVTQIDTQTKKIDSIDPLYSGVEWLNAHYSVTQNPVSYSWGGNSFTYYYFWTVSKAWEIIGQEKVSGHDWYSQLFANLASVQSSDGHWPGTGDEESDLLATEWAVLSLELPIIPQQVLENSKLKVILQSGADLHVYDQQSRHVGYNYNTQQDDIQILGATYTGRNGDPQAITVPLTEGLKYTIEVIGTTGGPYELTVDLTTSDVVVAERTFTGTTSPRLTSPYSVDVVTIAGLSLLVRSIVGREDLNGDGKVNILDITIWSLAFGSRPGHPNWNSKADLNSDSAIDIVDAALICKAWTE